jgi:hypothetical protein
MSVTAPLPAVKRPFSIKTDVRFSGRRVRRDPGVPGYVPNVIYYKSVLFAVHYSEAAAKLLTKNIERFGRPGHTYNFNRW